MQLKGLITASTVNSYRTVSITQMTSLDAFKHLSHIFLPSLSLAQYMPPHSIHPYIRLFILAHITAYTVTMAGKKGENTKKAAGNARVDLPLPHHQIIDIDECPQKAEAAAAKQAVADSRSAAQEEEKWSKGAKSSAKKSGPPSIKIQYQICMLTLLACAEKQTPKRKPT